MKKILFIYPEMMMGGSTTSLVNLLNEFNYEKYEVDIAFRKKRGILLKHIPSQINVLPQLDKYGDNFFSKLIKVFILIFSIKFYISLFYKYIKHDETAYNQLAAYNQVLFCKKIKKEYDVVIGFLEGFSNIYANSRKVKAKKRINWIHIDYQKAGFNIKYDYSYLKKADKIVFVSEICKEHFREVANVFSDKLCVIENIISYKLIKNREKEYTVSNDLLKEFNGLKLLTVCRLTTNTKGLDRILNISKSLYENGYKFKWCIIGGNPDTEFKKIYNYFPYKDNVVLLGEMSNPFPYFEYFDIFVLSSRFEGKPMVVTEALMLNLPVICAEYSSASGQIISGKEGLIVENDEKALKNAIESVLINKSIIEGWKSNLINKIYSFDYIISSLEELLDN